MKRQNITLYPLKSPDMIVIPKSPDNKTIISKIVNRNFGILENRK